MVGISKVGFGWRNTARRRCNLRSHYFTILLYSENANVWKTKFQYIRNSSFGVDGELVVDVLEPIFVGVERVMSSRESLDAISQKVRTHFHAVYDGYLETIISESLAARIYVEDKGTFALVGIRWRHFGQYEQHCNLLEPDAKMSYRRLVIIFGMLKVGMNLLLSDDTKDLKLYLYK